MGAVMFPQIYRTANDKFNPEFPLFKEQIGNRASHASQISKDILGVAPAVGAAGVAGAAAIPHTVTNIGKIKIGNTYKVFAWNSFNTTNIGSNRRNEDDTAGRVLLFILGSVITGLALYKLGEWWHNAQSAQEELEDLRAFNSSIKNDIRLFPNNTHLKKLDEINKAEKRIFTNVKTNAQRNLALTVAAAVAGTFLALGAVVAVPEIIIAGAILGFVTGGAALLKLGFKHNDKAPARDAKIIRDAVDVLKKATVPEQGLAQMPAPAPVAPAGHQAVGSPQAPLAAQPHLPGNGLIRPVHPGWSVFPQPNPV